MTTNARWDELLEIWRTQGYAAYLEAHRADPPRPSDEELAQARTHWGAGTVFVDPITGEEYAP